MAQVTRCWLPRMLGGPSDTDWAGRKSGRTGKGMARRVGGATRTAGSAGTGRAGRAARRGAAPMPGTGPAATNAMASTPPRAPVGVGLRGRLVRRGEGDGVDLLAVALEGGHCLAGRR